MKEWMHSSERMHSSCAIYVKIPFKILPFLYIIPIILYIIFSFSHCKVWF